MRNWDNVDSGAVNIIDRQNSDYGRDFVGVSKYAYKEIKFFTFLNFRCFIIIPRHEDLQKERKETNKWIWFAPTFLSTDLSDGIINERRVIKNYTKETIKLIIDEGLEKVNPSNRTHPSKSYNWLFTNLLKFKYFICGIEIGETFGNERGIKIFDRFYEYMVPKYALDEKVVLLCQSRGGLMHYNWATENAEKVLAIAGIYPVCNLESWPNLENVYKFYGYNSVGEMENNIEKHNPLYRLEPLAIKKIPIFHLHGDKDDIVPSKENSVKLIEKYKNLGGVGEISIIKNEGHSSSPSFFKSKKLLEFFYSLKN